MGAAAEGAGTRGLETARFVFIARRADPGALLEVLAALAAASSLASARPPAWWLFVQFFLVGGMALPMYALCAAHANDFLRKDQMVGASSALLLSYGIGAALGATRLVQVTAGGSALWALFGLGVGLAALLGLRVASYDFPSRFVHLTAGVALPLTAAAPLVALPALRQAFGYFPPREREIIARRLLELRGVRGSAGSLLRSARSLLRTTADPMALAEAGALEKTVDRLLTDEGLITT